MSTFSSSEIIETASVHTHKGKLGICSFNPNPRVFTVSQRLDLTLWMLLRICFHLEAAGFMIGLKQLRHSPWVCWTGSSLWISSSSDPVVGAAVPRTLPISARSRGINSCILDYTYFSLVQAHPIMHMAAHVMDQHAWLFSIHYSTSDQPDE